MKKTFKFVGVVMTSVALLFASCSNDSISVETNATANPDVVAKAYPGYNRIVWSPVTDGNTFSVVRDDGKEVWFSGSSAYDYDVEDGVEYTYTLYTKSNAADRTETKVGNKTSVTVKAIKPALFGENGQTHALDLAYYEDGTYKADASKDFIVSAENIKVNLDSEKEKILIQVPQKVYLNYLVKVYRGNSFELMPTVWGSDINQSVTASERAAIKKDKIKTDITGLYSAQVLGAGEYRVEVTVSSENYAADKIIAKETAKIEAVGIGEGTRNVTAHFFDNKNTKARVMWTPAKDNVDWQLYPVANYTVYAYNHVTNELTKVTDEIKATKSNSGDDVYYVDTTTLDKKYAVVLSVNGKYESASLSSITSNELVWYEEPSATDYISKYGDFTDKDADGKNNDFVINIYDITTKQKVSVKYFTYDPEIVDYQSYSQNKFSEIFVSEDYVKEGKVAHIKPEYGTEYEECVVSNVPEGQKVAYEITVSEEGKKDFVKAYTSSVANY